MWEEVRGPWIGRLIGADRACVSEGDVGKAAASEKINLHQCRVDAFENPQ